MCKRVPVLWRYPLGERKTIKGTIGMKKNISLGAIVLVAVSVLAADSDPKDEVKSAAKKLASAGGYSWKTTVETPQGGRGGRFRPGPTEGQAAKDGTIHLSMTRG